jgi:hypothetical protein
LNNGNYSEVCSVLRQLEADQVRAAIALSPGASTGEYDVKEIKRPVLVYNIYLLESG